MSGILSEEFEAYRGTLPTEEDRQAFDRKIEQLLQEHGVDYVRGYVDGLSDKTMTPRP
jgi:nicotinamide riboside kinase